jgi:hypothetical protein
MTLASLRRLAAHPLSLSAVLGVTLGLCGYVVFVQVAAVRQLKQEAIPLLSTLPDLSDRLAALSEQVELMELQRLLSTGNQDEVIRAYVLPDEPDLDRLLSLLDALTGRLRVEGKLSVVEPIRVGDAREVDLGDASVGVLPVELAVTVTESGKDDLLAMLRLSGLLTVSDALRPAEITMLLQLTERENPAGIAALEQHFLSVDLLRYARETKSFEERLTASFPSPEFADAFAAARGSSTLSDARRLLGGAFGDELHASGSWPMRLLEVERAESEAAGGGMVRLRLSLRAYVR